MPLLVATTDEDDDYYYRQFASSSVVEAKTAGSTLNTMDGHDLQQQKLTAVGSDSQFETSSETSSEHSGEIMNETTTITTANNDNNDDNTTTTTTAASGGEGSSFPSELNTERFGDTKYDDFINFHCKDLNESIETTRTALRKLLTEGDERRKAYTKEQEDLMYQLEEVKMQYEQKQLHVHACGLEFKQLRLMREEKEELIHWFEKIRNRYREEGYELKSHLQNSIEALKQQMVEDSVQIACLMNTIVQLEAHVQQEISRRRRRSKKEQQQEEQKKEDPKRQEI